MLVYLCAALAGKTDKEINKVKSIGHKIGIAFQIQDDLLEIFSEEKNMGKSLVVIYFIIKKLLLQLKQIKIFIMSGMILLINLMVTA